MQLLIEAGLCLQAVCMHMEQNRGKWGRRGHSLPTYNRKKILIGWDQSDWQGQGTSQLFFLVANECQMTGAALMEGSQCLCLMGN